MHIFKSLLNGFGKVQKKYVIKNLQNDDKKCRSLDSAYFEWYVFKPFDRYYFSAWLLPMMAKVL